MPTTATATVSATLDEWKQAERTGDRERLGELLTDDFVGIGPVGFVLPRHAWLDRFGPDLRYDHLDLDEVSVRTNGDTTIVVAHQHAAGEARGNPVPPDTRVSFVMVPDRGRRRIAGIQYSFIVPVS
jgi:ketosteroid isomerase-like protein